MHQEVEYFDFDKVDESKDYYLVQDVKTNEDDVVELMSYKINNNMNNAFKTIIGFMCPFYNLT